MAQILILKYVYFNIYLRNEIFVCDNIKSEKVYVFKNQ